MDDRAVANFCHLVSCVFSGRCFDRAINAFCLSCMEAGSVLGPPGVVGA